MDATLKQPRVTLVELIIVAILVGMLAAGAYYNWPGATINLGGQANQLADDIRYTQSLSMTTGQSHRLIKTSDSTYQIVNNTGTTVMRARGGKTMTLNSGITFGALTNLPNSLIAFDGRGAPYFDIASPDTQLASTATISLTANGQTKTVVISPQTGRTLVQ